MQLVNALNTERFVHGLKTALACLIGFAITKSVHFPVDQWLLITIIVVMCAQLNVGSVIQKSYMRFLGTFTGSLLAALTLLFFGTNDLATAIIVGLSALIFSYIATGKKSFSEAGTLGAVTVIIILIGQHPTVITAAERFIEISIGILIAAIISQFVLPVHARRHLRDTQAATLRQLRAYYLATLLTDQTNKINENYHEIDESIAQSLITQRKLANEAKREPLGTAFDTDHFQQSLACEKEILRSISFMHHVYEISPDSKKLFSSMSVLYDFHDKICCALQDIANAIQHRKSAKDSVHLPRIQPIQEMIDSIKIGRAHL